MPGENQKPEKLTKPKFFSTPHKFREWLKKNHATKKELLVGFYRVGSGKKSITWPESVNQALCFGWIDGIRRSIDDQSYTIRFTPRKPGSNWSAINIRKMQELGEAGLIAPAGARAFSLRKAERSGIYSYEKDGVKLSDTFEKQFKKNKTAWKWFSAKPPSYKKPAIHWVMSAKLENTRVSRFRQLVSDSEAGISIKPLRY
jgi:uncharacterized protein YdeI (YjbR/CyaY-like superfamily)